MESIKDLTQKLDEKLTEMYGKYVDLHQELDKFRGKQLSEQDDVNEANRLLKDIQLVFAELYHAYNFITYRHQYAVNAINTYNDFIAALQKAGAQQQGQ